MVIVLPIRTVLGQNAREHHMARHKRIRREKEAVHYSLHGKPKPSIPCVVLLTRISPNKCDDDNLSGAMKSIRDAIATWLGVDDGDDRVKYRYAQERGPRMHHEVRIEFKERE